MSPLRSVVERILAVSLKETSRPVTGRFMRMAGLVNKANGCSIPPRTSRSMHHGASCVPCVARLATIPCCRRPSGSVYRFCSYATGRKKSASNDSPPAVIPVGASFVRPLALSDSTPSCLKADGMMLSPRKPHNATEVLRLWSVYSASHERTLPIQA